MELHTKILLYVSYFSVLVPIFFLFREKQNFTSLTVPVLKALGLLLFISAFSDLVCYTLSKMGRSHLVVSNSYIIAQFFLLSYIYSVLLKNKMPVYVGFILFIGFISLNTLYIQAFTEFQSWTRVAGSLIFSYYSILYYIQHIKQINTKIPITSEVSVQNLQESRKLYESIFNPTTYSNFLINSAVSLYFMMNLGLFLIIDYTIKNEPPEIAMLSWSYHNGVNIIKNVLFAAAIYQAGRKAVYDWSKKDSANADEIPSSNQINAF